MNILTVQRTVARYFELLPQQLDKVSRKPDILVPRQIAHYLCKEMKLGSLAEIGVIGNKDHASVIHSHKTVCNDIDGKRPFCNSTMDVIIAELTEILTIKEARKVYRAFYDSQRDRYVSQKALICNA